MRSAYKINNQRQKEQSQKQKPQSQSNKKKPIQRASSIQTYDDVCISYGSPCNSLNNCIQMVRFMKCFYNQPNKTYEWKQKEKDIVNNALGLAITNLNKALEEPNIDKRSQIYKAIVRVRCTLETKSLKIYPLDEPYYGAAQAERQEISINVAQAMREKNTIFVLAKTLIHEAFHIIGGCNVGAPDETCLDNVPKDEAFSNIKKMDNIGMMEADDFAQFVMMCGN